MKLKALIGIVIVCLAGIALGANLSGHIAGDGDGKGLFEPEPVVEVSQITMVCAGDIMAHKPQYNSALQADGTYDFTDNYAYIKDYIEAADIAFCNVETVFGGQAPRGYPTFCAPDELAANLKSVGFDVAITSNNHMLDCGSDGVLRNLEVLQAAGLRTVGSQLTEEEANFIIVPAQGLNVGVVAYTYQTSPTTINAINIPSAIATRVNSFDPDNWETDIAKIEADVQGARDAGADMVVCYFHWGEEYSPVRDYQREMASRLAGDSGMDVIFASHPHICQEAEVLWSDKYQKNVPVYYSIGNFISNQRQETLGGRKNVEDGILAGVTFDVTRTDGVLTSITLSKADVLPTWVNRYQRGGAWAYHVVPLDNNFAECPSITASGMLSRATASLERTTELINSQYPKDEAGRLVIFDASQWVEPEPVVEGEDAAASDESAEDVSDEEAQD
ncbi:MAG: CapA family protein [Firmicutes bacterium]|nr:CapA family protein [Bacillota bacterium]